MTLIPFEINDFEKKWRVLEKNAESYFQTWDWIGTWLKVFGGNNIVFFNKLKSPADSIYFFSISKKKRLRIFEQKILTLNTSTDIDGASVCTEYNDFLISGNNHYEVFINSFINDIKQDNTWDIINIQYMLYSKFETIKYISKKAKLNIINESIYNSYFTDLHLVKNIDNYFDVISKSSKTNILQNTNRFSKYGKVSIIEACSAIETKEYFSEMKELNILRFGTSEKKHVFSLAKYIEFHNNLIETSFPKKEISIVKVKVGETLIGILYSFIYSNNIYFYQSGFNYLIEPRLSPGVFTLFNVMLYYSDLKYDKFYFLAGNELYKQRLATGKEELVTFDIQNNNFKNRLINIISKYK